MHAWPVDHELFPELKEFVDRPELKLRTYPVLYGACVFMIGVGLIKLVKALIYALTSELVVTSQRVIGRQGWIRRRTMDIRHIRFESFETDDQSVLGRILGYGTLTAHGSGGTTFTLHSVFYPLKYRDEANRIMDFYDRSSIPSKTPAPENKERDMPEPGRLCAIDHNATDGGGH
jgi:hypothetical protein